MAEQKVPSPTFHALGLSTTREVLEGGGRLAGNKSYRELVIRQSKVFFQVGRFDRDEFDAELAQESKIVALFVLGPFDIPHPNRGKVPRRRPNVGSIDRCRVARIGAVNRGQNQTAVVNVTADRADLVERPTELHATMSAHASVR